MTVQNEIEFRIGMCTLLGDIAMKHYQKGLERGEKKCENCFSLIGNIMNK